MRREKEGRRLRQAGKEGKKKKKKKKKKVGWMKHAEGAARGAGEGNTSVIRVTSRGRDRLAIIMATLTLLARIVTLRSAHAKLLEFSWPRCNTFPYGRTTMACICCECQDSMISNCEHALILLTLRKIYVFVYR